MSGPFLRKAVFFIFWNTLNFLLDNLVENISLINFDIDFILNLFQRFVGKMHKVREDKKKLDDRTGSIETITEVAEGETALAKATSDDGNGLRTFNPNY